MLLKRNPEKHFTASSKKKKATNAMCELAEAHLGLGVLLTEVLGSVDHVGERALDLIPLARLETAVGVDPELLRTD
jgi:hypothetical protein